MNRNTVWARAIVDELVRAGVRDVCIAPGSRSTPLVLECAARSDVLRLRVFIDERSAGFFALGLGKATGLPAVVLTTSGTAVANLLPAVVEASHAEVPLIALTADRPPRLRDADANQAIDQVGIFGRYVRVAFDCALPEVADGPLRHLRGQVARIVAGALGLPAGPVHLNVPFDKPLEPVAVPGDVPGGFADDAPLAWSGRPDGAPFTRVSVRRPRLDAAALDGLSSRIDAATRGVIVAGMHPGAATLGPLLRRLARATGMVLLADPLSGARWPAAGEGVGDGRAGAGADGAGAVPLTHDLWLGDAGLAASLAPDFVLRIGAAPTSTAVLDWMARHADVEQLVLDAGHRWKDHGASAHEVLAACPLDTVARLVERQGEAGVTSPWVARWSAIDDAARAALTAGGLGNAEAGNAGADGTRHDGVWHEGAWHEGHVARALVASLGPGTPLFVSSSMPIRDLDGFGGARTSPLDVFGNRGASGIDGIASTALGVAAGCKRRTVALVGDLAFLHDVNGLLAAREPDAGVVFVVVDNDGGGIFDMLPIAAYEPHFTPFFATPHGVRPEDAARLYGLPHRAVATPAELAAAVLEALAAPGSSVISITSDRAANAAAHRADRARAQQAAREAARVRP